jgi:serine/threonine protein kinase
MNYPLISEYIEAIKSAEDNFGELSCLRPVLGDDGLPVMTSGNFAVVFKMKDEQSGKFYAVKCFTKEQEGRAEAYREIAKELENVSSPYILSIRYLDKELFVDTDQTTETEFPVLLMDWVEGKTLEKYLRENLDDKYALEMLAYRFSQLAQWLIPQPFAHGDLKPDNILVREDGTLVLVDYDGMYVPSMKGQKARELGSPDFRHPSRTGNDFDERIDDFPLVSILLSITAISLNPQLLDRYGTQGRLILSSDDYLTSYNSKTITKCKVLNDDSFRVYGNKLNTLVAIFEFLLFTSNEFITSNVKFVLRDLYVPYPIPYKNRITSLSKEEVNSHLIHFDDDYLIGKAKYSDDGTRLIRFYDPRDFYGELFLISDPSFKYDIKSSAITICDKAFSNTILHFLNIPNSVKYIGSKAFYGSLFKYVELPWVDYISGDAFERCDSLHTIAIPQGSFDFFSKMLPNNIEQLVEIHKSSCIWRIKMNLYQYNNTTPLEVAESLLKSLLVLHNIRDEYSKLEYKFYRVNDGISCDIWINDKNANCEYWYNITNVNDIDELSNSIYYLLLDLGLFCRYDAMQHFYRRNG